jgi:hypothetical protein
MTLVIDALGTNAVVRSVEFEITGVSTNSGYSGNTPLPEGIHDEDFSFHPTTNSIAKTLHRNSPGADGAIDENRAWTRIHSRDYGGSCTIKTTLVCEDGKTFSLPPLRIPLMSDGNSLPDLYVQQQQAQWEAVYTNSIVTPWPASITADVDAEPRNLDGRELCPVEGEVDPLIPGDHATLGDGFTAFEEYRGFILDYGPSHTGGHHRLSIARRELLIMTAEMPDIPLSISVGSNTNNLDATNYYAELRESVTAFYRDPQKGAGIDLYWVNVPMDMGGEIIVNKRNSNGEVTNEAYEGNRPSAYYWDWTEKVTLTGPADEFHGGSYIYDDKALKYHDGVLHTEYFSMEVLDPDQRICNKMWSLGHPKFDKFVKLALINRWGYFVEQNNPHGFFCRLVQNRNAIEVIKKSSYKQEGAYIAVAVIAEEGGIPGFPHYTLSQFTNLLNYATAHELGHLILYDDNASTENLKRHPGSTIDDANKALMGTHPGREGGLTIVNVVNRSRRVIDLHKKASTPQTDPN